MVPGISKADVAKLKAAPDRARYQRPIGVGDDRRLHLEERQQIGQEESLVGNARSGRKHLLQIAGGLNDGVGQVVELADVVVVAGDRAPDHKGIGAVVAKRGDHAEQTAGDQLLAREGDILLVNALGELGETVGEVIAQVEELELFGAFAAAGHLAQIIHLPLGRGLAEVLRIAEEGEMGLSQEGGQHAERQQKHQPGRVPEQDGGPDQRGQGLLEEPAHLLDHGQAIGGLYPGPFQAVVEDGIFVGRQVQRCRLAHHPDADEVGVAVGQQAIAVVDAARQQPGKHVEAGFQPNQPPKMRQQPLWLK